MQESATFSDDPQIANNRQMVFQRTIKRYDPPEWHDVPVPDESHSEQLRRESDELLATAAKLIEHAATLKAKAAELQKQIARLECDLKQNKKKS